MERICKPCYNWHHIGFSRVEKDIIIYLSSKEFGNMHVSYRLHVCLKCSMYYVDLKNALIFVFHETLALLSNLRFTLMYHGPILKPLPRSSGRQAPFRETLMSKNAIK